MLNWTEVCAWVLLFSLIHCRIHRAAIEAATAASSLEAAVSCAAILASVCSRLDWWLCHRTVALWAVQQTNTVARILPIFIHDNLSLFSQWFVIHSLIDGVGFFWLLGGLSSAHFRGYHFQSADEDRVFACMYRNQFSASEALLYFPFSSPADHHF